MGRASKVKYELRDAVEMLDLVQTLKDVADNKYFGLINSRIQFKRFAESFREFFRLISLTDAEHPFLSTRNPVTCIIVVTVEGSFLGQFNNAIIRRAFEEMKKHQQVRFIGIGDKCVDQIKAISSNNQFYDNMEGVGYYETAVAVKTFVMDEVMNGRMGKVIICHSWPKNFEVQKMRTSKIFPCEDLLSRQAQIVNVVEKVIEESDPVQLIAHLADIWITTRLYEIFIDTTIASAAAQSNFLEDSVDRLKKENKKIELKYRKVRKGDIDKSLRETFASKMIAGN